MRIIKLLSLIGLLLASNIVLSQSHGITYQAVLMAETDQELPGIDVPGGILPDRSIRIRFTIQSSSGSVLYQEVHETTTDEYGIINVVIADGQQTTASPNSFIEIDWDGSPMDLKVEIDLLEEASTFEDFSEQALYFVPYAFHRKITATGTMEIEGVTDLNADFNVNNNSTSNLSGPVDIGGTLGVDGASTLNNSLTVTGNSPTTLTGTLGVTGATVLDNTLNVTGATALGNTLNVTGATELDNTLNVTGASVLNNTLNVTGVTSLADALNVTGATTISNTLGVSGITTLSNDLVVANGGNSLFSGGLSVDGITNINNAFNVTGANASTFTGVVSVDGATSLNNSLNVNNGATGTFSGPVNVTGITTLDNALNVNNGSATNLSGALDITGITTMNDDLNVTGLTGLNGQVTINANVSGSDTQYNSYPLQIEGSGQGIAISLSRFDNIPNNGNNFITFFNNSKTAVGRIEGQTQAELRSSAKYQWQEGLAIAETVKAAADVGLAFIPMPGVGAIAVATVCVPCIAMAAADAALAATNLALFYTQVDANYGVTYESGSADYAEWLERLNPNEKISPGEIVGVYGGKISKYTKDANQFMVISTKPAMLGNMPKEGQEDLYEKVAFMGQIPARVRGFVIVGDYILPSGLNDGTGIAVSPDEIRADQFASIIGVAWSPSYSDGIISSINMAIGLNTNDVANLTSKQEVRINQLENRLQTLEARFTALENGTPNASNLSASVKPKQVPKPSRYDQIVASMPSELSDDIMEDAFDLIRERFELQGINIEDHSGLNKLFNDQSYRAEIIKKAKENYKISYQNTLNRARLMDK